MFKAICAPRATPPQLLGSRTPRVIPMTLSQLKAGPKLYLPWLSLAESSSSSPSNEHPARGEGRDEEPRPVTPGFFATCTPSLSHAQQLEFVRRQKILELLRKTEILLFWVRIKLLPKTSSKVTQRYWSQERAPRPF